MIKFHFSGFAKVLLALLVVACQSPVKMASAHIAMINVGDEIDGMKLTKGAADARPLWAFCASKVSNDVTTANCRVPQMSKLAIGHVFFAADSAFRGMEWSELQWELYIDDMYINLEDFGTHHYVLPTMAPNPSFVREVFMKFTAWDVVLTNLQPGEHTIEGHVRSDAEEYSWIVNLVIEDTSPSLRQPSNDSQSQCPRNVKRLSSFHHSCRIYG
jgi:hypothetical protein